MEGPPWFFWLFMAIIASFIVITICVVVMRACMSGCSDAPKYNNRNIRNANVSNMFQRNGKHCMRRIGDVESDIDYGPSVWDTAEPNFDNNYGNDETDIVGGHHGSHHHSGGNPGGGDHHSAGDHHSGGHHHSGTHDNGDTGRCDSGGGVDSGGGCDSGGGGDSGGACDSGGGGDSGGGCDSGGGTD